MVVYQIFRVAATEICYNYEQMEKGPEHLAIEQEIKNLSAEIKERGLGDQGKEAVRSIIKEQIPQGTPAPVPTPGAPVSKSTTLPGYLEKEAPEVKMKVEHLLDLAFHHGIKRAADEAKKMSPLELDAFHDALTDKLYGELKSRGLLK